MQVQYPTQSYPLVKVLQGEILSDLLTFAEIPLNAYFTKMDHTKLDGSFIADRLQKISEDSFRTIEAYGTVRLYEEDFLKGRTWVIVSDDFKAKSLFSQKNYEELTWII